jgi:hypothetical protein
LDEAIRLDRNDACAFNERSEAKRKLGRLAEAVANASEAL